MTVPLGFGIVCTLLTVLFCYLYYGNSMHASNLDTRGLVTEAEIIRKFEEVSTATSTAALSQNPAKRETGPTSYFIEYEYHTLEGQVILETENVGKEYQDYLKIGDLVDVKYDPQDPKISTIAYINGYKRGTKILTILVAIFSILTVLCWMIYFKNR